MGSLFWKQKRFKMGVAFIVAAVMVFTFAVAANVKKTGKGRTRQGDFDIPICASRNTLFTGAISDKSTTAKSATECAEFCADSPLYCRHWAFYQPCHNCEPTDRPDYTCLFLMTHTYTKAHRGWHSSKRGCK